MKKIVTALLLASLFLPAAVLWAGPNMKEGLWEITTRMEVEGISMPPQTHTQCLTKEDMIPRYSQPGQECKITKQVTEGDTVSWVAKCETEEGTTSIKGKVTYKGNSFEGVITMKQGGEEMTSYISGHWIGECAQ